MLEDETKNETPETSVPKEPQTVHIFVGGLRRPSKTQLDTLGITAEMLPEKAEAE